MLEIMEFMLLIMVVKINILIKKLIIIKIYLEFFIGGGVLLMVVKVSVD